MILYHGSTVAVQFPRLIQSDKGRDFGTAFYLTDLQVQAEKWAWRHARINRLNGLLDAKAIVSVFVFDEVEAHSSLKWLELPQANLEWLELVLKCRGDISYNHGFDSVSGKVADDNVGRTVSYVQQGIMRKEDALERLKFQQINNQIAFCTLKALQFLHYQKHYSITKEPV